MHGLCANCTAIKSTPTPFESRVCFRGPSDCAPAAVGSYVLGTLKKTFLCSTSSLLRQKLFFESQGAANDLVCKALRSRLPAVGPTAQRRRNCEQLLASVPFECSS